MTESQFSHLPLSTSIPLDCDLIEQALLQTPAFNKGSAFPQHEREAFGLVGLLPTEINTLEDQAKRAYDQYSIRPTPLDKNTFMNSLKTQNEVLFYRLIQDHLKEMFPIIYTPTEGDAIANYSRLFRRPEGCFLSIANPDNIEAAMNKWGPAEDVDIIACSDGEQILGTYICLANVACH
jgi:malate dehydrogenase (oxaloacetate-decarboxylating)